MKHSKTYVGCDSAAEAEAKMVVENHFLGITATTYFGTADELLDHIGTKTDFHTDTTDIYLYVRDINFNTGRLGDWVVCKSNWA